MAYRPGSFLALAHGGPVEDPEEKEEGFKAGPEEKLAMYEFLSAAGFGGGDSERVEKALKALKALFVLFDAGPHEEGPHED